MSTSPVDPQDVRAAAEVHRELGPEYSDAVIAEFIDRVDRAVAARVEARLAEEHRRLPATRNRRTLLKGVALGVCAGALLAGVSIGRIEAGNGGQGQSVSVFAKPVPGPRQFQVFVGPNGKPQVRVIKPGNPPPAPPAAPKS
jgi:hypothetical protein